MKSLALIAVGLCCIAAPLAAQQDTTHARRPAQPPRAAMGRGMERGERGGMDDMVSMMHEMMGPMIHVVAYTPDHLLAHKDSLQLTSDQVAKLTAIRESAKAAHDAAVSDVKTHMNELSTAFQNASPDTNTLRMHFQAAHTAMGKAHWAMLTAAAQSRAVLTDAQRSKIDTWVTTMEHRESRDY
ncbi:MAG TPA: Spy/CpxP family protein refolding chaperone [Gemmatimonadales bacterium]|nr:Spy/CpxP family protein refolding chaperone [Gemmatimonadales bacterium]